MNKTNSANSEKLYTIWLGNIYILAEGCCQLQDIYHNVKRFVIFDGIHKGFQNTPQLWVLNLTFNSTSIPYVRYINISHHNSDATDNFGQSQEILLSDCVTHWSLWTHKITLTNLCDVALGKCFPHVGWKVVTKIYCWIICHLDRKKYTSVHFHSKYKVKYSEVLHLMNWRL